MGCIRPGPDMALLPPGFVPKMLICDIDGTLTDENQLLHAPLIDAFQRLEAAGIPVALATGNVRPTVWTLARHLRLSGPLICENGGLVWDWRGNGEMIHLADGARAKAAVDWLATQIEGLDPVGITSNAWRETEWCLWSREDDVAMREHLDRSEWADLEIVRTGFAIHVAEPNLHKGHGVAKALELRGIEAGDVVCVGDAPNDLPMFDLCGWAVAVGGARAEVAAAADAQGRAPHGETVVELIEEILQNLN